MPINTVYVFCRSLLGVSFESEQLTTPRLASEIGLRYRYRNGLDPQSFARGAQGLVLNRAMERGGCAPT